MPVTTRTLEQYRRVQLGHSRRLRDRRERRPSPRRRRTGSGLGRAACGSASRRPAGRSKRSARSRPGSPSRAPGCARFATRTASSSISSPRPESVIPDLSELAADLAGGGWTLSVQGRKVYLVPAALTKEAALAEVQAPYRHPELGCRGRFAAGPGDARRRRRRRPAAPRGAARAGLFDPGHAAERACRGCSAARRSSSCLPRSCQVSSR